MIVDSYGNRRFYGIYRGIVVSNADPLNKGRVKVQVPQVLATEITDWAWSTYTPGIQDTPPAIGQGVFVQFEGGDPSFPIWTDSFTSEGAVDYLQLNTTYTGGSTEVGMFTWNTEDETPEVKVGNGEVTLQIGQEFHTRVSNNTGSTIPNGTVVYLFGGADTHGHPYVAPYRADGAISPFRVVGITTQAIPNNSEGLVTVKGKVRGLNTAAYLEGDILYASATVLGGFQNTPATAPDDVVVVAAVVNSDATDGELLVNVVPLINQLQTNLVFFPTTTLSNIATYYRMVDSTVDPDYNSTAVAVPIPATGNLNSGTAILVGSLVADANEFVGNPGTIEMQVTGSIAKTFGNANTSANFYFRVYRRTSGGTETLMGESSKVGPPSEAAPIAATQFSAQATVPFETFSNTDRLVVKFFADILEAGNQRYAFTYGGISPVRVLLPVPVNTVSTPTAASVTVDTTTFANSLSSADNTVQKALETLDDLSLSGLTDVNIPSPTNGQVLSYNTSTSKWVNANPSGGVTSIVAGTNLTGGTITTSGTIALSATPTGVTSINGVTMPTTGSFITSANFPGTITGAIYTSTVAPTVGVKAGDHWLDPDTGNLFVYYEDGTSNQWVQTSSGLSGGTDIRGRVGSLESRTTDVETLNTTQNGRLTAVESLNTTQDSRLTAVEGVNTTQNGRLTSLEGYTQQNLNYIINSSFDIWQRGTTGTPTTAATRYVADRWETYRAAYAAGLTVSRQVATDVSLLPNIQYCMRVQRTAANAATGVISAAQALDTINAVPLAGKPVTLSFYARAGANYSSASSALSVSVQTGTGTDQPLGAATPIGVFATGAAAPISQTATLTTSWQRFSYSGTIATSATQVGTVFTYTPVGTAGAADYFEVTGVQLEVGSVATSFRRNAPSIQAELAACQRYFVRWDAGITTPRIGVGAQIGTTASVVVVTLPVTMRKIPVAADLSWSGAQVSDGANFDQALSALTIPVGQGSTDKTAFLQATHTAVGAAFRPIMLILPTAAGAFIAISAEL